MVCVFFGNKDTPQEIKEKVYSCIKQLITEGVDTFYVGNHGTFDNIVISVLIQIKKEFPQIKYGVVLAYMPKETEEYETIFPEEVNKASLKYRIDRRNKWMLKNSDVVVTYVFNTAGRSAEYKELAKRKGKRIIELS